MERLLMKLLKNCANRFSRLHRKILSYVNKYPKSLKKIYSIIKLYFEYYKECHLSAHSAQATLFIFVSIFPFLFLTITILQLTPYTESTLTSIISTQIPLGFGGLLKQWVHEIYNNDNYGFIVFTIAVAVWASSKGFLMVGNALEVIYNYNDIQQNRKIKTDNFIIKRTKSIVNTVIFCLMLIVTFVFIVIGKQIIDIVLSKYPFLNNFMWIYYIIRYAFPIVLLTLYLVLLYRFLSHYETTIKNELPGAFLSSIIWIAFSYGYSIYMNFAGRTTSIYGSIANIVMIILWMYFGFIIIFSGSILNNIIRKKGGLLQ